MAERKATSVPKPTIERGAPKTPRFLPFPLERNYDELHLSCAIMPDGSLYLGQSRYSKRKVEGQWRGTKRTWLAQVRPHKNGLAFWEKRTTSSKGAYWERTIIPGEMGFTRVVHLLAERTVPIKSGLPSMLSTDEVTPENEMAALAGEAFHSFNHSMDEIFKDSAKQTRRREVAAALLQSGIWQSRGRMKGAGNAPSGFWRHVPGRFLTFGDHRTMRTWWLDTLHLTVVTNANVHAIVDDLTDSGKQHSPIHNADEHDAEDFFAALDEVGDRPWYGEGSEEEEESQKKRGSTKFVKRRATLVKYLNAQIRTGAVPEHPWDIRGWKNLEFEDLTRVAAFGLHRLPAWSAYVKSSAPDLNAVLATLRQATSLDPEKNEALLERINFFMQARVSEKAQAIDRPDHSLRVVLLEDLMGQVEAGRWVHNEVSSLNRTTQRTTKFRPGKTYKQKHDPFYLGVPKFAPPDGWAWDRSGTTPLAKHLQKNSHLVHDLNISERAIATRQAGRTTQEVLLQFNRKEGCWQASFFKNCTLPELRAFKILERSLRALNPDNTIAPLEMQRPVAHPTLVRQVERQSGIAR